jgi:hypothetical protein
MTRGPTSPDAEALVPVAHANDRAEAAMIQGLLESAGIASVQQRIGIDGPALGIGWLNPGGGSQRVLVRTGDAEEARALLAASVENVRGDGGEVVVGSHPEEPGRRGPRSYNLIGAYARIWMWSFAAMALAFGIFLLLRLL